MIAWLLSLVQPEIRSHLLRDEGEVIVDVVAHHWIVYVKPALVALLGLVLFIGMVMAPVAIAWLPFVLGGAVLLYAGLLALREHMDRFVITNMRVFRVKGVFTQSLATMPLSRILDITVQKPFSGRLMGYGHFVFESAAQAQGLREIVYVGRVDERDLAIQRVVQRAGLRGGPKSG